MDYPSVISVRQLRKRYRGGTEALRGVSLEIGRGEVFGLLGPNGAGKSTLIRSLLTLVRPTGGEASLFGLPPESTEAKRRIGYLPEHARFPEYLTARQLVAFHGRMVGLASSDLKRRVDEVLAQVGAAEYAGKRIGACSKGMKQRIGLAQALVGNPDLLFLDEPTDGVDPAGRREIRDLILELRRARGCTVFINSHQLLELEHLCDRVAILVRGEVVAQGTLDALALGQASYEIDFEGLAAETAETIFAGIPGIRLAPGRLVLPSHDLPPVQACLDALRTAGASVKRVQPLRPSLEELYLQATGSAVRPNGHPNGQGGPQ